MRKTIIATLLALIMVSCGTDKRHFKIDGRLLNLNQGEFYVYSPDGSLGGVDTIKVQAGRFTYKVECQKEMTLMIVFPNFTEQPVFAAPGKTSCANRLQTLRRQRYRSTRSSSWKTIPNR